MLWNVCSAFPILPHLWLSKKLPDLMEWPLNFLNRVSLHISMFKQPLFKWIFIYVCKLLSVNKAFNIKRKSCKLILSIHPSIQPSIHRSVCLSIYLSVCLSACLSIYIFLSVCHSACASICPSIFLISSNSFSIYCLGYCPFHLHALYDCMHLLLVHLVSSYTSFCI